MANPKKELLECWKDVYASSNNLDEEVLDDLRCWLRDASPQDLVKILRAVYNVTPEYDF